MPFLQQFEERLSRNYSPAERKTAEQILDHIADYRNVLLNLEYDNFLIEGSDFKWRFSLNLLRLWWRANRGMY